MKRPPIYPQHNNNDDNGVGDDNASCTNHQHHQQQPQQPQHLPPRPQLAPPRHGQPSVLLPQRFSAPMTTMPSHHHQASAHHITNSTSVIARGAGIGSMLSFPNKAHPFPHQSRTDGTSVRIPQSECAPEQHDDDVVFDVTMPLKRTSKATTAAGQNETVTDSVFVKVWGPRYLFCASDASASTQQQQQQPQKNDDDDDDVASSAASVTNSPPPREHRLVVFIHGAGMSSASFHLLACRMLGKDGSLPENLQAIPVVCDGTGSRIATCTSTDAGVGGRRRDRTTTAQAQPQAQQQQQSRQQPPPRLICAALDLRGHGRTKMALQTPDEQLSYDIDSLAFDVSRVMHRLFEHGDNLHSGASPSFAWTPDRAVCLIGHSVGGSVASIISEHHDWRQRLFGLVLLDIVEGTAMESLRSMPEFLKRRPTSFASISEAVTWFVRCGGMRSAEAARISVPSLLREVTCSNHEDQYEDAKPKKKRFEWIADLRATEPAWSSWFGGMDGRFLHAVCPRMLCLSSPDKLDKDLTVAHMQGQFQFEVFRDCGHYLHEDAPDMVAPVLLRFISRIEQQNEKLRAVFVKKFGGGNNNSASAAAAAAPASSSNCDRATASAVGPGYGAPGA